jgi:hypothetical protein
LCVFHFGRLMTTSASKTARSISMCLKNFPYLSFGTIGSLNSLRGQSFSSATLLIPAFSAAFAKLPIDGLSPMKALPRPLERSGSSL